MVVQAIALLDDLDKEINIYSMRVKVRVLSLHACLPCYLICSSVGMVRLALPGNG